jgi:hypothetical protein
LIETSACGKLIAGIGVKKHLSNFDWLMLHTIRIESLKNQTGIE